MYFLSLPVVKRIPLADGVTEVTFGLESNAFDFKAGQFVRVIVPELKAPDARGASRDFTISSFPGDKNISIAFRSEKPSGFKQTLLSLPYGARVTISGPHGEMILPSSPARPLVFVAGGIGITGFITKIRAALAQKKNYRITLLWSMSRESRMPYLAELRTLAREHAKRFALVEVCGGRIDEEMLKKHLARSGGTKPLWQIAGRVEMVTAIRAMLANLKVAKRDIAYEEYEGYERPGTPITPHHVDSPIANLGHLDMAAHISAPLLDGLLEALDRTASVSMADAEGTILFTNDRMLKESKYAREELLGQNHRVLKSGHHSPEFYRNLWQTISSGRVWRGEIMNRAKDGSYYWVDTSIAPIMGKNGAPERYVSVRFGITDKKKNESALSAYHQNLEDLVKERTEKLSAANAMLKDEINRREELENKLRERAEELAAADRKKDEFIAVLSHELRNPLSPVISSMELIEMQGMDHPSTAGLIKTAHIHLRTMADLLDDLLDVNRITRKEFTIQKETVALQTILRHAIETAKPFAENKRHRVTLALPREPVWIQADPLRLAQIFGNVLSNAIKYTKDGGEIAVRCVHEGESIIVTMKDNGIGISKDMQGRIFEMFVRGKSTIGTGLGIGLSLTKRLVEMHGGSIEALSEGEGKGSEFIIRLPASEAVPAAPARGPAYLQKPPGRKFKILVVDDNEAAAKALGALLERRGHQVVLAHEWRVALKEASNGHEVMLLDIGMPEMDGYELARRILREVASPPALIALTGYGQEDDKRKAREAGFASHLTKPVGLAEIEEALMGIRRSP